MRNKIIDLLSQIITRSSNSLNAAEKLIYYLKYPKEEVPAILAEAITQDPALVSNQLCLGSFIARGHVNDLIIMRDLDLRARSLYKISRQINRIGLYLENLEAPAIITSSYSDLLTPFYNLMILLDRNQSQECSLSSKEVHLLFLEEAISAYEKEEELTKNLVEMLINRLNKLQKINFATDTIFLLSNIEDSLISDEREIIDILKPDSLHLKKSLTKLKSYYKSTEYFRELATDICPTSSNLIS